MSCTDWLLLSYADRCPQWAVSSRGSASRFRACRFQCRYPGTDERQSGRDVQGLVLQEMLHHDAHASAKEAKEINIILR